MNESRLSFFGGTGSVTGANFLLDTGDKRLLVDCGAVAQERVCDMANFEEFGYDVTTIDALFVTHSHADHIGRIPRLVRAGFRGVIYSTPATKDISAIMFEDAYAIMKEEAEKHGCDMLYEVEDIDRALSLWRDVPYHTPVSVGSTVAEFYDAGHILGSALVRFSRDERSIFFSGDLGNVPEPLLRDTEAPKGAQYLVVESVYGDRVHENRDDRRNHLREVIERTRKQHGVLLIPSFSIERTQVLLSEINTMIEDGVMEPISMYLDSPLASRITPVFRANPELFNDVARARIASGDDLFSFPGLTVIKNKQESQAIHDTGNPKVIIAGAGMSGGGRIRSHELYYLGDPKTILLFVGYQAPGTLGRRVQDGARSISIDGEQVRVRAEIDVLTGYSGHADRDQILDFIESAGPSLEKVFVTMGEKKSSLFLGQRIRDFLGIEAVVPEKSQTHTIHL